MGPMAVPGQWSGSVEHFYHFFLGYLYPLVQWLEESGHRSVTVRDCGPMNPWLSLLEPHVELEVIPPGLMLHRFARQLQPAVVLDALDDPETFDGGRIQSFVQAFQRMTAVEFPEAKSNVVLLNRASTDPYFATGNSEVDESGVERRSVPNMQAIARRLEQSRPTALIDTALLNPVEQIQALAQASTLVAQHGAGLVHMVWMQPNSTVVEILPPSTDDVRLIFHNLARALGHQYARINQLHDHAEVQPALVEKAIDVPTGRLAFEVNPSWRTRLTALRSSVREK